MQRLQVEHKVVIFLKSPLFRDSSLLSSNLLDFVIEQIAVTGEQMT